MWPGIHGIEEPDEVQQSIGIGKADQDVLAVSERNDYYRKIV